MTQLLVTNDDGIDAPGLLALSSALLPLGAVQVAAPAHNQSASGHKKTLFNDLHVQPRTLPNGVDGIAVGGSPADGIALAAMGLRRWPPDLVVSGINRGENMSQDITYSGTVTAALEAVINGVPAVAISLANREADTVADYAEAARVAAIVVRYALAQRLPPLTILNLNIPAGTVQGLRLTRQGVRIYRDALQQQPDGSYRIVGEPPTGNLEETGTDLWAVNNGYASLTPIHLDMTAHHFMADLAAWDIRL
ncbi:MAG: 5'/3'-nucleotidase SurE [Anaerolineae bacterium]|jgi:5'-nucleotidase|nr:5'/3'-nucleotidase SurE [Anaerolineae bacterium]